jgi:hypothetical protein
MGGHRSCLLLRLAVLISFLWLGHMKSADRGFNEMCELTMDGSIIWALGIVVDGKSAAAALGAMELLTVAALAPGTALPLASALGAAMECALLATALLLSTFVPYGLPPTEEPYLLDIKLLGASSVLLSASVRYERTPPGAPLRCPSHGPFSRF